MAASTAFPPFRRMETPTVEQIGVSEETIPLLAMRAVLVTKINFC
jgi:hypothetical protein